jgi:hypothetical protein
MLMLSVVAGGDDVWAECGGGRENAVAVVVRAQ